MRARLYRHGDLLLAAACALVFTLWPQIDLWSANLFYAPGSGWPLKEVRWIRWIYQAAAQFWVVAVVLFALLVCARLPRYRARFHGRQRALAYLLVVLLIGPGLTVDLLKNHWDRARPRAVAEFNGQAAFTPPLLPTNQCARNCSFVSGHAAVGFYVMAGFWLTRRRRWLAIGLAAGLGLGLMRMAVGAHFLSDIVFTGLVVHFTCRGLAWLFRLSPCPFVTRERLQAA